MSLDVLRGFDMFWILYPTYPILHTLLVALGLSGCWFDRQMDHPEWIGFTFYDTIYPLFLFLAGVSFPFSYAKSRDRGMETGRIVWKTVRRIVLLVLLGSTIFGSLRFDPKTFTLFSVIGRIGLACGAASFVYMAFGRRMRLAICLGILLLYGFLPFLTGCPDVSSDVLPYSAKSACIYSWMDSHFFPKPLFFEGFAAVFSMVATALLGMFAGDLLLSGRGDEQKVRGLLKWALVCLVSGVLLATALGRWSVPIIKNIWTSSFALVSASYSFGMLALFYWLVDVKGWRKWGFFFRVIGMNAVFAYLASRTVFPWRIEMNFLFGGLMSFFPDAWGAFVGEVGYMSIYWMLLLLMYRKGVFLKV